MPLAPLPLWFIDRFCILWGDTGAKSERILWIIQITLFGKHLLRFLWLCFHSNWLPFYSFSYLLFRKWHHWIHRNLILFLGMNSPSYFQHRYPVTHRCHSIYNMQTVEDTTSSVWLICPCRYYICIWNQFWWWWWWIVFCGMVDRRKAFSLISSGTIVRDPHHRESPTRREKWTWVQA